MSEQPAKQQMPRRRKILLSSLLILVLIGATGGGYLYYRIDRFAASTFRPDDRPPQTEFGETPTAEAPVVAAQLTPEPTQTPEPVPTHDPRDPNTPTPLPVVPTVVPTPTIVLTPTPTPLPYTNSPVIKRLKNGERITVLLIGFGGQGHDGGYLTDTLQVMSFDPKGGDVTLISVPRDLFVMLPTYQGRGGYWGRINEAYIVGMGNVSREETNVPYAKHEAGGQTAMKAVAQVLGIPIDYWISMDFVGFRQFIDAIGGVDVNVERAFTDYQYPNNDDANVDPSYRTVRFEAGLQHMNGEAAITFARSRYSSQDGNDFNRSRRQQLLMTAVKDKVFRVETIPKLLSLLDAFEGHLRMSFSFSEAKDLLGWGQEQARAKQQYAVRSGVLESGQLLYSDTLPSGAYVLFPRAGQGVYSGIHSYVANLLAAPRATPSGTPELPRTPGTPGATITPIPEVPRTPPSPTVTPTRP